MWNRPKESEIQDIHEIGSSTKLYYFWVKGYSPWGERERHTIFLCWLLLHLHQTTCGPRRKLLVWPRWAPKVNLLPPRQELNSLLFLKSSKSSAHASGAWRHSHPLILFLIWGFILTSVNDASSPCAREHTRSCLHLTNQCTEPKGSHPN